MTDNSVAISTNRGFKLPVCPFSLLVFVTTVILVTRRQRQTHYYSWLTSTKCSSTTNENDPSTENTVVPLYIVFVLGPPGVGKCYKCDVVGPLNFVEYVTVTPTK